jgi:hypothetical protein
METMPSPDTLAVPPDLLAEIQAEAKEEHRHAGDVLRDVIQLGLEERRRAEHHAKTVPASTARMTPAEAVTRILKQRNGNVLPEGVTIRDLMTYGRA